MKQADDLGGVGQRSHIVELHIRCLRVIPFRPDHLLWSFGARREPLQHLLGIAHRGRQPDSLDISLGDLANAGEYRQQVPATIIAGKRMEFVDDDDPHVAEELVVIDFLRNKQDFQRLRRRQQTVGLFGDYLLTFTLRCVTVPKSSPPTNKPHVLIEPLLLIVQEGFDRADVKNRDAGPRLFEHL